MKKILFTLTSVLLCAVGLYFTLSTQAQGNCTCLPPQRHPDVPRFPQGQTVNVYIDATGFRDYEITAIEQGLLAWNGQPNNSGIIYNIIRNQPPPTPGTEHAIVVSYSDTPGNGLAGTQVSSQGPIVYMTMTFYNRIRLGMSDFLPALVRIVAKHEGGHGLGLECRRLPCWDHDNEPQS